jgi:hypothetical protein
MGDMAVLTRSIMPCINHSYADQVDVTCNLREAAADKLIDFGRVMVTISDVKAAFFNWTSVEPACSACCGGPTPVASQ